MQVEALLLGLQAEGCVDPGDLDFRADAVADSRCVVQEGAGELPFFQFVGVGGGGRKGPGAFGFALNQGRLRLHRSRRKDRLEIHPGPPGLN